MAAPHRRNRDSPPGDEDLDFPSIDSLESLMEDGAMTNATPLPDLTLMPWTLWIQRFPESAPVPWNSDGRRFFSVTRAPGEISVVSESPPLESAEKTEGPFCCFQIRGPLPFSMTGILSSLTSPLAAAKIPIFAVSTFDTDYLLVPSARREEARRCLAECGFHVDSP